MSTTTNLNLFKAENGENYAKKKLLNDNWDKIDAGVALKSNTYTKAEVDALIEQGGGGGGTVDAYTKAESDARYLREHQSLAAYRTSAAQDTIDAGKAAVGSSYTKTESDGRYLTTHQDISGKANVGDCYTKTESDGRYLTAHQSLSAYRTASAQDAIDSGKMAAFTVGTGLQLVNGVLSLSLPVVTADTEF